jgi:hypothetical protein
MSNEYYTPLSKKELCGKISTQMAIFYGLANLFEKDVVGLIIEQLACPNCGGVTCSFCEHGHDNRLGQKCDVFSSDDERKYERHNLQYNIIEVSWCACCAKYALSTICSMCWYGDQCTCYKGQAFTYDEMMAFMAILRDPPIYGVAPGGDGFPDQTQYEWKHWEFPFIDPTAYGESAESSDKRAKEFDSLVLTLTEFEKEKN